MLRRGFCVAFALLLCSAAWSAEPIKALVVDGRNNHDWKSTTPVLKQMLEAGHQFTVDVATAPPKGQDLSGFQPKFSDYQVVVINYNDKELWPEATRQSLVKYVEDGGGVLVVHAGNNAFESWPEFNEMIGLGWRGNNFGDRVTVDEDGKVQRTPKGEGPGAGHGPQHAFQVVVRQADHPITKGLPQVWMHAKDELYHGQRGPGAGMQILATAFSAANNKGTGTNEPMIWVIERGQGRVVTNLMGHSVEAMKCVGFQVTIRRGAEFAATGKVTSSELPANFPSAEETSSVK